MAHIGNNVARLRGLFQIPQKEMAAKLDIFQQDYSKIEHREVIEDGMLDRIAGIFNVPAKLIKSLDEQFIQNVYQNDGNTGAGFDYRKMDFELYERLIAEKDQLLKMKDEMLAMKDQLIEVLRAQLKK